MSNRWTSESKTKQAQAIRKWKPWEKATGPRTPAGKAISSRNAFKGGKRAELRRAAKQIRSYLTDMRNGIDAVS